MIFLLFPLQRHVAAPLPKALEFNDYISANMERYVSADLPYFLLNVNHSFQQPISTTIICWDCLELKPHGYLQALYGESNFNSFRSYDVANWTWLALWLVGGCFVSPGILVLMS